MTKNYPSHEIMTRAFSPEEYRGCYNIRRQSSGIIGSHFDGHPSFTLTLMGLVLWVKVSPAAE
jgi:hypothetical protein